ncbi:hypothetical protein DL767_007164 [Monosporascus sp. MG133]|nr:hypothetical protein DL767_007164 [Monosporascus sp. MG133]
MPTNRADARPTDILGWGAWWPCARAAPAAPWSAGGCCDWTADGIGFSVYRDDELLNSDVLPGGSNFVGSIIDLGEPNTHHVRPVVDGEGAGGERRVHAAGRQPRGNRSSVSRSAATTPSGSSGSATSMATASISLELHILA